MEKLELPYQARGSSDHWIEVNLLPSRTQIELDTVIAATMGAIARHPSAHPEVLATSAADGSGIGALRAAIAALLAPLADL